MTTTTQAAAATDRPVSLVRLVVTELLKIRTTRLWWGLLLGGIALAVLQSGLTAIFAGLVVGNQPPTTPGPDDPAVLRAIYSGGFTLGAVIAMTLGILGMTGEFRHQTITPTFLATPRRGRVVLGKLGGYLLAGLGFGLVMVTAGVLVGGLTVVVRGYPLGFGEDGVPRTIALSVAGCAVWTVFGLGIGTLIRNQVAALCTAIGVSIIVDPLLGLVLNQVPQGGNVAQFLPGQASAAIVAGPDAGFDATLLPWWGGLLVIIGYGLLLATMGAWLTLRRDVT